MNSEERNLLRKSKIKARDSYSAEERQTLSEKVVAQILASSEFQQAKTVMIYKGIRGEVRLESLENVIAGEGKNNFDAASVIDEAAKNNFLDKRFVYPLCISGSEMIALFPKDPEAWVDGYFGIREPVRERSEEVPPEEIDLVICPCTVFDERGGRMGMGAGFYDRYLEKCTYAVIAAVAFECQKTDCVPRESWDKEMDLIFTEEATYRMG